MFRKFYFSFFIFFYMTTGVFAQLNDSNQIDQNTENLSRDLKPFVLQKSLNDFYVEYELNVYTKQPSKIPFFYSELYQSIQREFNKAGVEILSPHYHAIRDGNATSIPGETEEIKNPVEEIIDKVSGKK